MVSEFIKENREISVYTEKGGFEKQMERSTLKKTYFQDSTETGLKIII